MGISSALGSSALLPSGLGFRNMLINGDFRINQRGFTSTTANATYGFDRWVQYVSDGTVTYTPQTFTVGNAIPGYEPTNYAQIVTTGQTLASARASLWQAIEGVRTFAGQTVTVSFWAKATSGTPKVAVTWNQQFGTSGSSAVDAFFGQVTLSTSWARYTITGQVPSISGKTIGTANDALWLGFYFSAGSNYNTATGTLGIQSNTFQIWGVQAEANYQPTPFEQRPIGVELALCQRYYQRFSGAAAYSRFGMGVAEVSTISYALIPFYVEPRTTDTTQWTLSYSAIGTSGNRLILSDGQVITNLTSLSVGATSSSRHLAVYCTTAGGLTIYRLYYLEETSTGNEWVAVSMEL